MIFIINFIALYYTRFDQCMVIFSSYQCFLLMFRNLEVDYDSYYH